MKRKLTPEMVPGTDFMLYQTEDGQNRIQVRQEGDTVWLTQAQMAELYQTSKQNISQHLKHIFKEKELDQAAVVKETFTTASDNKRYSVNVYRLEAILAVGYRVSSPRGTQFRRWATQVLGEYVVKGFTLDDERLKNPPIKGSALVDHFDDLLERIRDIRASEKRMYLRVREIFALAADYAPKDEHCLQFFRVIQNKLHFAATQMTAAELINARADRTQPNMGLTSWKNGRVHKSDVTVAKNYLREGEIKELNRIVSMWLDFAEDQARRKKQVFLKDWDTKLDEFLRFNDRQVLAGAGKVSKERADAKAAMEYEAFAAQRREALENEGEAASIAALEELAKKLPQKTTRNLKPKE